MPCARHPRAPRRARRAARHAARRRATRSRTTAWLRSSASRIQTRAGRRPGRRHGGSATCPSRLGRVAGAGRAGRRLYARPRRCVAPPPASSCATPAARVRVARLRTGRCGGAAAVDCNRDAPGDTQAAAAWRVAKRMSGAPRTGMSRSPASLADDLAARFGERPRLRVVPDGPDSRSRAELETARGREPRRGPVRRLDVRRPVVAYAGHLYAWKGVDVLLEALALVPDVHGLIVGGHAARTRPGTRQGSCERLEYFAIGSRSPGWWRPGASRISCAAPRSWCCRIPRPPSRPLHVAAEAVRVHGGRPGDCRVGPAVDPRGPARRGECACSSPAGDAGGDRRGDPAAARRSAARRAAGAAAAEASHQYSWERRAERLEDLFNEVVAVRS